MFGKYKDAIAGSFLVVISIVLFVCTYSIVQKVQGVVGAAFMPRIGAIVLFITGFGISIQGFRTAASCINETEVQKGAEPGVKGSLATIFLLFLYIALLPSVGFLLTSIPYLFLQMWLLAPATRRRPAVYIIISVIAPTIVYYTFVKGFNLMLPAGVLG